MTPASLISEKGVSGLPAGCLFPEFDTESNMKVVRALTGQEVLLDDDVELPRRPFIVAKRYAAISMGGRGNYMMVHHFVFGAKTYLDHINGNPLDNRRENLRQSRASENVHNQAPRNKLGVRGVYPYGVNGMFRVMISKDRVLYHVGVYDSIEKAAHAYNQKAVELYGENARLNNV
jgi:hypothetical protein